MNGHNIFVMSEPKSEVELISPEKLIPYGNNPKEHPEEQIDKIASSIKNYGFDQPIVVDEDYEIIKGHGRLQASKKLGLDEVPVIVRTDLSDAEKKASRIADNRTAESEWDDELLSVELEALEEEDFNLSDTGFDEEELSGFMDTEDPEDLEEGEVKDVENVETDIQEGDIIELGSHRLMCGDSTDKEQVHELMNGEKADLVVTDPPWGVDYDGGTKEREKLEGDGDTELYGPTMQMVKEFTTPEAPCYLFYAGTKSDKVFKACKSNGFEIRNVIVWVKNQAQFGALSAQYKEKKEPMLYLHKQGEAPNWYGPNNETTVWEHDRPVSSDYHPTQKPVSVVGRAIQNSSLKEDNVLDLYGGSGSTLMAAEQTGRKAFLMEKKPEYCQVIKDRFEEYNSNEVEL